MKCPRCQQENPPQAKFCLECAAPLALRCANCGSQLPAGAKFCFECATPVSAAGSPPRFVSPETYTPKHLAERIINSKAALEGERKQVTVLFADLKGSMELLVDRDPEEARKILDPVLELMMEAVHRYEGTVNQVMGDGIMALFGAPVAHEDHAVRSCYAALRMQDAAKRYSEVVRHSHGIEVPIRVGLNSGEVVVRSIGSDLHMNYTAVGQTTHLAARMEQLAVPGTILLSEDTRRLAEGFVHVSPLGQVPIKGLADPIEVFELTGAATSRTRFQVATARGLTRFVGRATEIAALHEARARVETGQGQVVAVIAEPGVGKSRLFWEFTHSEPIQRWLVLKSAAASYGKATPYRPVIDFFKSYFQVQDHDDAARIREKVTSKLMALDEALAADAVVFLSLLDVPVDDRGWEALDPLHRRRRTLDAGQRLLLRESRRQPLVLVFEDLHWIDSETQTFLAGLAGAVAGARILLLVNYRPEYQHDWAPTGSYTEFGLNALPPGSAGELLSLLLGSDPDLDGLKQALIERGEGNPFFLEEGVRTLIETGALTGERGVYRLVTRPDLLRIPTTIQAVLAARIDRLSAENKKLLQTAAVIGKDVPVRLLGAVAETPDETLVRQLADLQAAEFLHETRRFPEEVEYTFKHALTHDVAYGGLLENQRRTLHARIVEATENLYAGRLAEQVDRLAYHAMRGEAWDKAVLYLHQGADKAAGRCAHRAAIRYMEDALVALTRVAPTAETTRQAIDGRFAIRNWLFALGEHTRIRAHLEEAQRLAQASADTDRLGWTRVYMSNYFWREGDPERAVELGRQALEIADERRDVPLTVTANLRVGQAYHGLGDYRRATQHLQRNVLALTGEDRLAVFGLAGLPLVFSRSFLVWSLAEMGQFQEGIAHGKEAIEIADASGQMYSRAFAHFALGFLYLHRGDPERALSVLKLGHAIQETGEILALRSMFLAVLGHARTLSECTAEAVPLIEQSVDPSNFALSPQHAFPFLFLGKAYLAAAQLEPSLEAARRSLELCRSRRDRGGEASSLLLVGETALHRTPPDAAQVLENCGQALALAKRLGMRPLVAHCHLGLGKLYRRTDKREQAQEHLATATTMYREMGMTYWLQKAEAETTDLGR